MRYIPGRTPRMGDNVTEDEEVPFFIGASLRGIREV
jgi:hypothetical protein